MLSVGHLVDAHAVHDHGTVLPTWELGLMEDGLLDLVANICGQSFGSHGCAGDEDNSYMCLAGHAELMSRGQSSSCIFTRSRLPSQPDI